MVYGRSIAVGVCLMTIVVLYSGLIFYLSLGKFDENYKFEFKRNEMQSKYKIDFLSFTCCLKFYLERELAKK